MQTTTLRLVRLYPSRPVAGAQLKSITRLEPYAPAIRRDPLQLEPIFYYNG